MVGSLEFAKGCVKAARDFCGVTICKMVTNLRQGRGHLLRLSSSAEAADIFLGYPNAYPICVACQRRRSMTRALLDWIGQDKTRQAIAGRRPIEERLVLRVPAIRTVPPAPRACSSTKVMSHCYFRHLDVQTRMPQHATICARLVRRACSVPHRSHPRELLECRMTRQASSGAVDANPVRGMRDVSCTVLRLLRSRDIHFASARRSRTFSEVSATMRCPIASHECNLGFPCGVRCRRSGSRADCSLNEQSRLDGETALAIRL